MDVSTGKTQVTLELALIARQVAKNKANIAKWGINSVVFLFALLIITVILTSQGINPIIVSTVAILGLTMVLMLGWRRGKQLYTTLFNEELLSLQERPSKNATTLFPSLTPREIQVLEFTAKGYSNKQIAIKLGISQNTVKNFIARILAKLDAKDRTEATVIAIKNGLISVN